MRLAFRLTKVAFNKVGVRSEEWTIVGVKISFSFLGEVGVALGGGRGPLLTNGGGDAVISDPL